MYRVIIAEKQGDKILIDKKELEKLLEDAYNEGYNDGSNTHRYWQPYITYKDYITTSDQTVPYTYTTITCSNGTR